MKQLLPKVLALALVAAFLSLGGSAQADAAYDPGSCGPIDTKGNAQCEETICVPDLHGGDTLCGVIDVCVTGNDGEQHDGPCPLKIDINAYAMRQHNDAPESATLALPKPVKQALSLGR